LPLQILVDRQSIAAKTAMKASIATLPI